MQELLNIFLRFAGLIALVCAVVAAYNLALAYRARRGVRSALFDAERQVSRDRVNRSGLIGAAFLGLTLVFFGLALVGGGNAATVDQPTRTPTRTVTPRAGATSARPATPTQLPSTGGPTVPPPPQATKIPAPTQQTPSAGRKTAVVTGTADVGGLKLRQTPNGEVIDALPDGTVVELLGETRTEVGLEWQKVRDPKNREGWVAGQYLIINP